MPLRAHEVKNRSPVHVDEPLFISVCNIGFWDDVMHGGKDGYTRVSGEMQSDSGTALRNVQNIVPDC